MTDKNSHDLTAMSAQPMEVMLAGEKYKISRPTIDDWGALEQRVKQNRMNMLSIALKAAGEDREYITQKMMEVIDTPLPKDWQKDELKKQKNSIFFIWRLFIKHSPDFTEADFAKVIDEDSMNRITAIVSGWSGKSKNAQRVSPKKAKK